MVRQEWKKLFHNRILLLVVIAVIAIPSIYTTLFWDHGDPYGKADQLPVAVVNKDQAVFYEGKELKIGEELTEKLKEDDSLDFRLQMKKRRNSGQQTGNAGMVLMIPGRFSANAPLLCMGN